MTAQHSSLWQNWCCQLQQQLHQYKHRACVVLTGDADWRHAQLTQALTALSEHQPHFSGLEITLNSEANFPFAQAVNFKTLPHHLGQETDFVVFSGEQGLDANALGQAGGMIRAGGILWLSLPTDWRSTPNPANARFLSYPLQLADSLKGFNQFFWQGLQLQAEKQEMLWVTQNAALPELPETTLTTESSSTDTPALHLTPDQQTAWQQIQSVAFGHRHRPLVLTADRGRGKSTLLGITAIQLLQQGKQHIVITAARLDQAHAVFHGAKQTLNQLIEEYSDSLKIIENLPGRVCFELATTQGKKPIIQRKTLQFIAPDELLALKNPAFDLLMVDEAAHLPLPLLTDLAERHNRVIFATTQQGYEGSGRGFALRFLSALKTRYPQTKTVQLQYPIRWAENDPLENTLNNCLLFAASEQSVTTTDKTVETSNLTFKPLNIQSLIQNRIQLAELFQLLTFAHYQTAPNDLMQLLETPNQQLWIAETPEQQIIAVLFALEEGRLPADNQRKQGHLFPQQMQRQTADNAWLQDKTLRIVRLAVEPAYQNQGIGSQLLAALIIQMKTDFDGITTSFGATPCLADFWLKNGFTALHLGQKRDKASGTHSLMMAQPFSANMTARVQNQQHAFQQQFAWLLTDNFQTLPVDLVLTLLSSSAFPKTDFPTGYLTDQPFEAVSYQLRQWTLSHLDQLQKIDNNTRQLWVKRILQNHSWESLVTESGTTSRKQLEQQFRHISL